MKKITLGNYRTDPYYPKVVRAVDEIMVKSKFVTPIEVFVHMKLLSREGIEDWRRGRVLYLEKVIQCNLAKASRILRLLRFHTHDLNFSPSQSVYRRKVRGRRIPLRFSKTGDPNLEEAYSRHFISPELKNNVAVKHSIERDLFEEPSEGLEALVGQRNAPTGSNG